MGGDESITFRKKKKKKKKGKRRKKKAKTNQELEQASLLMELGSKHGEHFHLLVTM